MQTSTKNMLANDYISKFPRWIFFSCIFLLILNLLIDFVLIDKITINLTPSLPRGFYLREYSPIELGDLVEFEPQGKLKEFSLEQKYLNNKTRSYLKMVGAVEGDTYEVKDDVFYINDIPIGKVAIFNRNGVKLPQIAEGKHVIKPGHILPISKALNSFDGRYYGEIPITSIKNKIKPIPLLTWN